MNVLNYNTGEYYLEEYIPCDCHKNNLVVTVYFQEYLSFW